MRYPFAYLVSPFLAAIAVIGFHLGGVGHFALPIFAFLLFPPVDIWRGLSRWPSEGAAKRITPAQARGYDAALALAALSSLGLFGWALWAAGSHELSWWQFAGLTLSVGLNTGMTGVVVAHELLHRKGRLARRAAFFLMSLVGYAHYCIEHLGGHHILAGTPEDPVTARRGQSIYGFVVQSVSGGFVAAWRLERERLERKGQPAWSLSNRILLWDGFTLLFAAAVGLLLGPQALLFLILHGAIAVFMLATGDYVEHYGLERERLPDGRYERISAAHSWNSSHLLTNVGLFNAGRHADHHLVPARPYHELRHHEAAPQLPFGYAAMILISLVPPLWFRVMDREIDRFRALRSPVSP